MKLGRQSYHFNRISEEKKCKQMYEKVIYAYMDILISAEKDVTEQLSKILNLPNANTSLLHCIDYPSHR